MSLEFLPSNALSMHTISDGSDGEMKLVPFQSFHSFSRSVSPEKPSLSFLAYIAPEALPTSPTSPRIQMFWLERYQMAKEFHFQHCFPCTIVSLKRASKRSLLTKHSLPSIVISLLGSLSIFGHPFLSKFKSKFFKQTATVCSLSGKEEEESVKLSKS